MSKQIVCSISDLFHYLFNPNQDALDSFLQNGIRPLSDFPESERWKQLEEHMLGFYKNLYKMIGEPVLQKPYVNSGVFITPIDFRLLPDTYLHDKPRFCIPVERIDPAETVLTYVLNDEPINLPFTAENREKTAALWDAEMVKQWFGIDNTKVFFYVPQVACYQGQIKVEQTDFEID
jgi:hypothetical protein